VRCLYRCAHTIRCCRAERIRAIRAAFRRPSRWRWRDTKGARTRVSTSSHGPARTRSREPLTRRPAAATAGPIDPCVPHARARRTPHERRAVPLRARRRRRCAGRPALAGCIDRSAPARLARTGPPADRRVARGRAEHPPQARARDLARAADAVRGKRPMPTRHPTAPVLAIVALCGPARTFSARPECRHEFLLHPSCPSVSAAVAPYYLRAFFRTHRGPRPGARQRAQRPAEGEKEPARRNGGRDDRGRARAAAQPARVPAERDGARDVAPARG
jgi:hypothetical protein